MIIIKPKTLRKLTKLLSSGLLAVVILAGQAPVFAAFEAHVVNVTAHIAPEPCAGYSIGGYKFNDTDRDGVREAGEEGLAGWIIELKMIYSPDYDYNGDDALNNDDAVILQAVADDLQICPAGRNCDIHPDGWVDNSDVADFQNYLNNLPLDLGSKMTDQNGHYEFLNLSRGRYQIKEEVQTGWSATMESPRTVEISQCGETRVDFGNYQEAAPECEMQLQKEVDKDTVVPGDILTYSLHYQNIGTVACAGPGVKIHDILDLGLMYLGSYTATTTGDIDGQGVSFGWYAVPGFRDNTVTWNANLVSPGEAGTISFQAQINTPSQCGNYEIQNKGQTYNEVEDWQDSNTVRTVVENPCGPPAADCGNGTVEGSEECDVGRANNGQPGSGCSLDCTTSCNVDLRIEKTDEPNPVIPSQLIEYTITYSNAGNCVATGAVLTESYDERTNFIESTPLPDSGTNNQWTVGNLTPGQNQQIKATVETTPQVVPGDVLVNKVCVDSEQTEPVCVTEETPVVVSNIVLNEFLPNPTGPDDVPMPGGEWVELYNKGTSDVEVVGWVLYDSDDTHELYITASNTDTGLTVIPPAGFLVVYRNGDSDFALNNSGSDSVRLYDGYPAASSNLIDSYAYDGRDFSNLTPTPGEENVDDSSGGSGSSIPENKSFARIPDGTGDWFDPIPTPGEPNRLTDDTDGPMAIGPADSADETGDEGSGDDGSGGPMADGARDEGVAQNTEDTEENGGAETQNTENTEGEGGTEETSEQLVETDNADAPKAVGAADNADTAAGEVAVDTENTPLHSEGRRSYAGQAENADNESGDGEENNTAQILPAENSEGDACLSGKVCDANGDGGVNISSGDTGLSVPDERMLAPP